MRFFITELPILPDRDRIGLHDPVHLAHDLVPARPVALGRGREVEHDAHVRGGGAVLAREDGIEIQLRDLRKIAHQPGDVLDELRQRFAVDRLAAAHALQDLGRRDAVQHGERLLARGGRQSEGDVLQYLDQDAAEAEGDQLAEARIGDGADDDLLAAPQHLLHLDAVDLGLLVVFLGAGEDLRICRLSLSRRLDAHHHAARLGLVQDVRRDDLHHDGEADLARKARGLFGTGGHGFLRHRDAIGVADQLALGRGQRRPAFGLYLGQQRADRGLAVSRRLVENRNLVVRH